MTKEHVKDYISKIRNMNKRTYADHYARDPFGDHLRGDLSVMAAQAVRMNIDELRRKK